MVDYIKISNAIGIITPQKVCKIGRARRDKLNRKYVPIIIPNRNNTMHLTFRNYEYPDKSFIEGNFRKWWFGEKSINDLDYIDFKIVLTLISKRIGISEIELCDFEVNSIEIGANIRMSAKYATIIQMFMRYPKLTRKVYSKGSIYFLGKKYSIIFYDKLLEMKERGLITAGSYNKLSKHMFILRIEKKIKAKSGVTFGSKIHTLGDILENWDFLLDDWLDILHKVDFIDLFDKTKDIEPNTLTPKENLEFLAYSFMALHGLDKSLDISKTNLKNRKSATFKKLIDMFNKFRENGKRGFFTEVSNLAARKAKCLKFGMPSYLRYESSLNNIESIGTIRE